ncbi:Phosphoserine phosphatase RsbP [Poriferisphaera corsica]|uniref:Phosphoserine phosphatase RsbP n=1 Tax=Poriferisphaera corsica TaxID=2528020 RepID=A0A517YUD7_9BACT|nr:PP2C family protein-serine/threonine phosphatase [Poriferisphaera corsica]QDU33855.1 Phosphoserine phosphatase RsbP [Poriferisphaera corsica]
MPEIVPQEFTSELDETWHAWLTRRFLRYCIFSLLAIFVISIISLSIDLYQHEHGEFSRLTLAFLIGNSPAIMTVVAAYFTVKHKKPNREKLLRAITWTIAIYGISGLAIGPYIEYRLSAAYTTTTFAEALKPTDISFGVLALYLLACIFIPWPPREAVKAVVPLWVIGIFMVSLANTTWTGETFVRCITVILAGAPGLLLCYARARKYSSEFYIGRLTRRYTDLKRELQAAQQIQNMLFPEPITDAPIQARYYFEPMQQIGGDFLYIRHKHDANKNLLSLTATLIDVTGHGITAALAVNRLHGELERLYAEEPDASPARVVRALNKYIYLTIAKQSIYATAISIKMITGQKHLIWANAGHPPAFLVPENIDTNPTQLDSTCMMLGVVPDELYKPAENTLDIQSTDRIIAYTDGVIEARNSDNQMLHVDGFLNILRSAPAKTDINELLDSIATSLRDFRSGPPDDDILVLEMKQP